jgi:hypothetical protein
LASPLGSAAAFKTAIGTIPIKVAVATDDEVIGYGAAAYWVGTSMNVSNVTLRSPALTGGHTTLFPNVPTPEVVSFFDTYV